jgi:hypothetical protein
MILWLQRRQYVPRLYRSYYLLQNMQVVPVPKDQYGNFYEGDSYIVYAASEYGKPAAADSKVSCSAKAIKFIHLSMLTAGYWV